MPTVIHSTQKDFDGPTILDKDALERLDRILAQEGDRLRAIGESIASTAKQVELNEVKNHYLEQYKREMSEQQILEKIEHINRMVLMQLGFRSERLEIILGLKSGKKIQVSSFEEASRMTELISERVIDLDVHYVVNDIDASLSIRQDGLTIRVRPETSPNAGELYSVLREWCDSVRSDTYMRIWYKARKYSFFGITGSLPLLLLLVVPISQNVMKGRAIQLAKQGVQIGQEREALQILLAIASDYEPTSTTLISKKSALGLLVLFISLSIFIQFAPKFEMALGLGTARIRRMRVVGKLALISIPAYVIALLIGHYWK